MNFGEKLAHAQAVDPVYARSVRSLRLGSAIFAVGLALALALAVWGLTIGFGNRTTLTRFEHTACAKAYAVTSPPDPEAVRRCEALRVTIAKNEGIEGPCVLYQRVTLQQGAACPRLYITHP